MLLEAARPTTAVIPDEWLERSEPDAAWDHELSGPLLDDVLAEILSSGAATQRDGARSTPSSFGVATYAYGEHERNIAGSTVVDEVDGHTAPTSVRGDGARWFQDMQHRQRPALTRDTVSFYGGGSLGALMAAGVLGRKSRGIALGGIGYSGLYGGGSLGASMAAGVLGRKSRGIALGGIGYPGLYSARRLAGSSIANSAATDRIMGTGVRASRAPAAAQQPHTPTGPASLTPGTVASRYPHLARALREGRITGQGRPDPTSRTLRLIQPDELLDEGGQVAFGRLGEPPPSHQRRPGMGD